MIPMSISEIADKFSICRLKHERTNENMGVEIMIYATELNKAEREHYDFENEKHLHEYVEELYKINGEIWDLETIIRRGREGEIGLEEVGKRALEIRNKNRERAAIKNRIVQFTRSGFEDIKVNHGADDGN